LHPYAAAKPEYEGAIGGKLNLFRFFVLRMLQLTKPDGRLGMIVPLALLADVSCKATRATLTNLTKDLTADCFPQKDNARRRIFREAKLSTVVLTGVKARSTRSKDHSLVVRVYPWNSFDDTPRVSRIKQSDIALIDPETQPVPLVN